MNKKTKQQKKIKNENKKKVAKNNWKKITMVGVYVKRKIGVV